MKINHVSIIERTRRRLHPKTASFQEIKKTFLIAMRLPSLKESVIQMRIILEEADTYRRRNMPNILTDKKVTQLLAQAQRSFN